MPNRQYRAEPADLLAQASFGPIEAIFHRRSGATHLVAAPIPEILAALRDEGPADVPALLNRLASRFDLGEQGEEAQHALNLRLEELVALGLVHVDAG